MLCAFPVCQQFGLMAQTPFLDDGGGWSSCHMRTMMPKKTERMGMGRLRSIVVHDHVADVHEETFDDGLQSIA
jgi:hypothetical protein